MPNALFAGRPDAPCLAAFPPRAASVLLAEQASEQAGLLVFLRADAAHGVSRRLDRRLELRLVKAIEFQEPIMRMLDCAKKIGLTMTDSYMMSPTKSVTAIIGISTEKERCPISGCEACGKKDCAYRR